MAAKRSTKNSNRIRKIKVDRTFLLFPITLIIMLAGYVTLWMVARSDAATTVQPTGTYTDWKWPTQTKGYRKLDWTLKPKTDPTPDGYFWATQFWFQNGNGGYLGIQTLGSNPTGKIAIFSIWDSLASKGPGVATTFGGEGVGYTARIKYNWKPGTPYRLRVVKGDAASNGTWWNAFISSDMNNFTFIGQILVPAAWGNLTNYNVSFTERYTGPLTQCSDIRAATAQFKDFLAIAAPDGAVVKPSSYSSRLYTASPTCGNSYVLDIGNGAEHHMGQTKP